MGAAKLLPFCSVSKIPFGAFRQFFAVCCAHNLFACGEQIPHLQPEKYFSSGTRPDKKCFRLCFPLTRLRGKFCEAFSTVSDRHLPVPIFFRLSNQRKSTAVQMNCGATVLEWNQILPTGILVFSRNASRIASRFSSWVKRKAFSLPS